MFFNEPIKHVPLKSVEEVRNYSCICKEETFAPRSANTFFFINREGCSERLAVVFRDKGPSVYITPYRPEIEQILVDENYVCADSMILTEDDERLVRLNTSLRFGWLVEYARKELLNKAYEFIGEAAHGRKIETLHYDGKCSIVEVEEDFKVKRRNADGEEEITLKPFVNDPIFIKQIEWDNIGTYIQLDNQKVYVCDEYGRSFLVTCKGGNANGFINALIDCNYRPNYYPSMYVVPKDNYIQQHKE